VIVFIILLIYYGINEGRKCLILGLIFFSLPN